MQEKVLLNKGVFRENDHLQRYTELTEWIHDLSSPKLQEVSDAESYRMTLLRNFTRIGELSKLNKEILEENYLPLLMSKEKLTDDSISEMRAFADSLVNVSKMDFLDLPMIYLQAQRLLKDAEEKKDPEQIIKSLDDLVIISYMMMYMTQRLTPCFQMNYEYRDIGIAAAERLCAYLDKKAFAALPSDSCREAVLINARYISALFDRSDAYGDAEINRQDFETLKRALSLSADPFYQEHAPGYNWVYHNFRTLQYIANLTELNNIRGYNQEQLAEIHGYTLQLAELWENNEELLSEHCPREVVDLLLLRTGYLAGEMTLGVYKNTLLMLNVKRDDDDFTLNSNFIQLLVPLELMLVVDRERLTKREEKFFLRFYQDVVRYAHHMPKKGSLSFTLTYLTEILRQYIELPGGLPFDTMCVDLMAALHPPTYVHSLSVADFTRCLTRHLLRKKPSLFRGILGCRTTAEVKERTGEIVEFAYRAALVHDVGKLLVTETILTYGRDLFAHEMLMVQAHPEIGAWLLERFEHTKGYANVARGHHRWYDNSAGYPENFDPNSAEDAVIIAIVACADCLDASTDTVGRSYKPGKTLEDFLQELYAHRGTRYAPYMVDLFDDPAVRADIETLLMFGRDENYCEAYKVLQEL